MEFEVDISGITPRRLRILLAGVLVAALVFLGRAVSPPGEGGRPQLLTPRLARILAYQRETLDRVARLESIQAGLEGLLDQPSGNLLELDSQANLLYSRLLTLQLEVDSTPVPPTLERLRADLGEALASTLDVAVLVSAWVSAPTSENFTASEEALVTAREVLIRIKQNPWLEAER